MSVHRTGKNHTGNRRHRLRLSGAASGFVSARRGRSKPDFFSGLGTKSRQAAALLGIEIGCVRIRWISVRPPDSCDIGDLRENSLAVGRHAPLDTAISASFADASLPNDFTFAFRIER